MDLSKAKTISLSDEFSEEDIEYFKSAYSIATYINNFAIYCGFIEKDITLSEIKAKLTNEESKIVPTNKALVIKFKNNLPYSITTCLGDILLLSYSDKPFSEQLTTNHTKYYTHLETILKLKKLDLSNVGDKELSKDNEGNEAQTYSAIRTNLYGEEIPEPVFSSVENPKTYNFDNITKELIEAYTETKEEFYRLEKSNKLESFLSIEVDVEPRKSKRSWCCW